MVVINISVSFIVAIEHMYAYLLNLLRGGRDVLFVGYVHSAIFSYS